MTGENEAAEDHLFVFVDTNIFLHFTFFHNIDWCSELKARRATLVLAPVVLDELDDKKRDGARREKERAKSILRAIGALDLATEPATIRPGVSLEALDEEPDDAFFAQYRLNPRNGDDRLLATILAFRTGRPGDRVVVLSDDTGLAIRGPRRGVTVLSPDESLRLADEPDEAQRELEAARREIIALKNAAPKLRLRFEDGSHLQITTALATSFTSVQRRALLDGWRKRYPHVSGQSGRMILPGGQEIDVRGIGAFQGVRSHADAEERNEVIDAAFAQYEDYLDSWPAHVNAVRSCIEIRLVIENEGTAFAHDVHLTLSTDARGIWREALPGAEAPPEPPRERSLSDLLLPQMPDFDLPPLADRDAPIDGPNIPEDNPAEADYTVSRVKHHVLCALPPVYFQLATDADVASFAIDYKLVAANLPKPLTGRLNVRITLAESTKPPNPYSVFERADDDDE